MTCPSPSCHDKALTVGSYQLNTGISAGGGRSSALFRPDLSPNQLRQNLNFATSRPHTPTLGRYHLHLGV
jgi:hypothetical protein